MALDPQMQGWLADLHRQHSKELLRWTINRCRIDLQEAGALLQQAFVELIQHLQKSGPPDQPLAWLRLVVLNHHRDLYRKAQRRKEQSLDDEAAAADADALQAPFPSPEELLHNAQLRHCIHAGLARFASARQGNEDKLLALRLTILDGHSLDEVAQALQRTPGGAMRVFMHSCRQAVRAYLQPCWLLINDTPEQSDE